MYRWIEKWNVDIIIIPLPLKPIPDFLFSGYLMNAAYAVAKDAVQQSTSSFVSRNLISLFEDDTDASELVLLQPQ